MVKPSCGNKPHEEKFKEHHSECEAEQNKGSDNEISMSVEEREDVSIPGVVQGNACDGLESAVVQEIEADLIVDLPEDIEHNVTTTETEEPYIDIKNETQDQKDLEGAIIKFLGDLDETEETSSSQPQTSQKVQSSPYPLLFFHVNRDDLPFQEIEESSMDPKTRDDHAERLADPVLEHTEETCFNSEIQSQATEEPETLAPPAKKTLKRRMGMCGLGDRKRKLFFDGQHCRQGLLGIHRQERALKGKEDVQPSNTVLESNGTTPMDHEETPGSVCKENDGQLLKASEMNGAAVMDDDGTTVIAEKEDRYNIVLMNDEANTGKKENHGMVNTDEKVTDEQVAFVLNLLEGTSTGMGQALPSPTSGTNLNMIQDDLSGPAAQVEPATSGEEPNFTGTKMTSSGEGVEFNIKHEVLSEKEKHRTDKWMIVDEDRDKIASEMEAAQEVSSGTTCAEVVVSEGFVMVTEAPQAVQTGLERCGKEIEEKHIPNLAAIEEHETNSADLSRSTGNGFDHMGILEVTSTDKTQYEKGQDENDQSATAVSVSMDCSGGDAEESKEISEPLAPPTGQKIHMHCFLARNSCDTTVTPAVAEQQVFNPTLNSAASELPQEADLSGPYMLHSMTDSQIHKIALSMELNDPPDPEDCDHQEDASELVRGLIRELSSLNRTVMVAHREMELLRRGKPQKAPNRRHCGLHHTEK